MNFRNSESLSELPFIRKAIFDIHCRGANGEVFYKKLHFKFLQMPLFTKKENELETHFDKWCYFLKHLESFDHIPDILREPIFEKAFQTSEIVAMNSEEYEKYRESLMGYWESVGIVETARLEGKAEGKLEGKAEGKLEIALSAIKLGLADNVISSLTDLTPAEIQKLREDQ